MKFNSQEYWETRYKSGGNSGAGSYGDVCQFKTDTINNLIDTHNLSNGLELGCGDGNQLKDFNFKTYTGVDVSETIVKKCKKLYESDNTKDFLMYNDLPSLKENKFDCTLSLDVIFHLVEDDVFEDYIEKLFNLSSNIVIMYTFGKFTENYEFAPHVIYRSVDAITQRFHQWKLIDTIKNKYPSVSYSEFYIYKKN